MNRTGWILLAMTLTASGCASRAPAPPVVADHGWEPHEKLSQYSIFKGDGSSQEPADGVIPYDLNSPLFSDYATKYRFVKFPPGSSAKYSDAGVLDFPVGTIIVKTFAYLSDLRDPAKGRRLIETRLLVHRPEGWVGLPYRWNESQTEAVYDVAGDTVDVAWIHTDGKERKTNYIIPNANQCKSCHENDRQLKPIGPKTRNLNKDFPYADGVENQLAHWTRIGALSGAPEPTAAPKLAAWNDPKSGSLDERARSWLEINCAHCHNPQGPARTSGLDLMFTQRDPVKWGVHKTPVAAGRGSGGRLYDVVPGKPDASIMVFRLESTDPGVMMPELPRRLVDDEGVALIREWIAQLPKAESTPPGGD